ncbi:hypothetical protein BS47DRAFT_1370498 [Hydnum rufescens UP504]|uniref:Dol-P-Man:Man(5)GlcNAc(2)-PP-Dol alpha-1,3-mannosyltransferase n=1 Tax=Hydnum rufescens UP504 TaxID=1448309 RepID=A0A9P6B9S4_9AGAM|nr:hypothetical protein BS47DRAFT_1370498 [Hydnum rufescens UP504]
MSLPGALKHILTLRTPNALASPGLSKLAPVLRTTWCEAAAQSAYGYAILLQRSDLRPVDDRTAKAALMRETGLKCAVFVGVPKVINSLAGLTTRLDEDVKAKLNQEPLRTLHNERAGIEQVTTRGKKLFASVYDPHTEKLLAKLGSYHPDFPGFIVANEYGALLSDPPPESCALDGRVGRTLTSVAGVACLRASGGVGPQLISHVYGLLKAREYDGGGHTPPAVGPLEGDDWLASAEGATWIIEVVDRLVDALHGSGELSRTKL